MANNTGFPINSAAAAWLRDVCKGLPGENHPVTIKPVRLYSRVNVPVGAATLREFDFFTANKALGIQNIGQGGIPTNEALALTSIRFGFLWGFNNQGQRLGLAAPTPAQKLLSSLSAGATAAALGDLLDAQWKAAEGIRNFMENGIVTFSIQNEEIFQVQGLTCLPDGKGSLVQAGVSSTGTLAAGESVQHIVQSISNGAPYIGNAWRFPAPWPLPAQQAFGIKVQHITPVDFAEADIGPLEGEAGVIAGTVTCELQGLLAVAK